MNKIILMGRMTRDPEVKYTQTGKVVTSFNIAVDRPFSGQDGKKEADFINCQIWGKQAETVGDCFRKGHRILVEGRLQTRSYDAKDGSKRYVTEVIVDRFDFIERKSDAGASPAPAPAAADTGDMSSFGTAIPFDEEIPF